MDFVEMISVIVELVMKGLTVPKGLDVNWIVL